MGREPLKRLLILQTEDDPKVESVGARHILRRAEFKGDDSCKQSAHCISLGRYLVQIRRGRESFTGNDALHRVGTSDEFIYLLLGGARL
jgi:hypothetical protein